MAAPDSKTFHRIARASLRPHLAALGFRQQRQGGEWVSETAGQQRSLRLQLSKWNQRDSPEGCEFTAELQIWAPRADRYGRLFGLLTDEGREDHRRIQNLVIAKLPLDDAELDRLPPAWQADRLARVAPRLAPYAPNVDIWFKYVDASDVSRWMEFIGGVVPGAFDRLRSGLWGHPGNRGNRRPFPS